MNTSNLRSSVKAKSSKRVGRGTGSGRGKTSGRGHKGAGQRKGRIHYIGHIGGNVPYFRKIPKRGFRSPNIKKYQIVNLADIAMRLKDKKEITPKELKDVNLIKDIDKRVKILARIEGEFSLKSILKAHKFSKSAKELIEKAGGKAECLML